MDANAGKLTAHEAKILTIQVWKYLSLHPEIRSKSALPDHLRDQVVFLYGQCPLCHFFKKRGLLLDCTLCPLSTAKEACFNEESAWSIWYNDDDCEYSDEKRMEAARKIYTIVEAWKIDEI